MVQVLAVVPVYPVSPPELLEWGMIVMHVIDPKGVLRHITQRPKE